MYLRPKTKKRVMILLIGSIAGAGLIISTAIVRLRQYENHLLDFRSQGLAAYHHGDYRTAAKDLSSYLGNDRVDGEAIFAYAVTRSRLSRADMGNLLDAKRLFNRFLELQPGDSDAEHQLLEIYQKLHYSTDVTDTAADLLKKNPDDVPALSAKLQQLIFEKKYADALPISMRLNELTPYDARSQETTFDLMARTGRSPLQIIDRGNALLAEHPDDPRFELVRALASYFTSNVPETKQWLRKAATRVPPDAEFTLLLAGSFDHLGMWSDSRMLLQNSATQPGASNSLKAKFIQRLWETNQLQTALAITDTVHLQGSSADSQLLGLKGLVLYSQNQSIAAIKTALANRPDDPTAAAWVLLLGVVTNQNRADVLLRVHQCQTAEKLDPDNPDIRFFLATDYLLLGEHELALQCLRQTVAMQPEWAAPQLTMAQIYLEQGQFDDAVSPAQTACDLDPDSPAAKRLLALVGYHRLSAIDLADEIQPLLKYIEQVRTTQPTDSMLLAAQVDLLARSNRKDEAKLLATQSLFDSAQLLSDLAVVNRDEHLELEKMLVDRANALHATTPAQALDQVKTLVVLGDIGSGTKAFAAMQSTATVEWKLAQLASQELLHDDAVGSAWQQFADSEPKDLQVQLAAMASATVAKNRTLMDRTINRVKALTSDDAIEWKLARATWLLGATEDPKNSANAAAASMADVVRQEPRYAMPQVIWADALVKLGDFNVAVAHLRVAEKLEPSDPQIKMKLTKLLSIQGEVHNTASLVGNIAN